MAAGVPDCVIVLAAGKGSRMGSDTTHKVCFEIDGVPAVVRALNVYRQCGIPQNLVVVGALAGQVVETVGREFDHTVFAYQKKANGTAGALRAALEAMPSLPEESDLLIVAGDRLIDSSVLEQLFDRYYRERCDLSLLCLPTIPGSGAGRILADENGEAAAILEMADIRRKRVFKMIRALAAENEIVSVESIKAIILKNFSDSEEKCRKAFDELWNLQASISATLLLELVPEAFCRFSVTMPDGSQRELSADDATSLPLSNTSVYITKKSNLKYVLDNLNTNNAQQEEYLSDIVALLRGQLQRVSIKTLPVLERSKVLGFNNPKELLEVAEIIRHRARRLPPAMPPGMFIPVSEYVKLVESAIHGNLDGAFFDELMLLYGDDRAWIAGHLENYLPLLNFAAKILPDDAPVAVVRAPGRVNVMGRHVDHQGGNCNLMTINFETLMAISPRADDIIHLEHVDGERFKTCEFSISELVRELPWEDWQSLVDSRELAKLIGSYGVDWSHYIKAAALRLQKKFSHTPLFGMNLFVTGNIPMAAGLSSSSSLIVGAAEAVATVNQLNTFPAQLVTLCGEGEWFVGTRGGAADHAAVKLGEKGKVVKVKFFDFGVEESVDFPESHLMVLCDSGISAKKACGAKDQFNHRVSCYKLGFKMLKKIYPQYGRQLEHLRDVNCENLGVNPAKIYEMLLNLPERATRSELERKLGENLSALWNTHSEPADGQYPIRSVVLYGLSECRRSKMYTGLLKAGNIAAIGELMKISHDGDRVAKLQADGSMADFHAPCGNGALLEMMDALASGNPARVIAAQLEYQCGGYGCSLRQIDMMIDIANEVPGVEGSQLAGAGLGGCMMVLVRKEAVDALKNALINRYYTPENIKPNILVCRPIAGSGILRVNN